MQFTKKYQINYNLFLKDFVFDGEMPTDAYTIRTIKVIEKASAACVPKAEITKGGIGQKFAEIKVTSASGCGLNSVVRFIADRPK